MTASPPPLPGLVPLVADGRSQCVLVRFAFWGLSFFYMFCCLAYGAICPTCIAVSFSGFPFGTSKLEDGQISYP